MSLLHEHDAFSEEDDTEEEIVLNNPTRPSRLVIPDSSEHAPNLYADSPRASGRPSYTVSKAEERRRKLIGFSTLVVLILMVLVCIVMIKYLSENENLR